MATTVTTELPDSQFYRRMRDGHRTRTGHELDAYLEDHDGICRIIRHGTRDDVDISAYAVVNLVNVLILPEHLAAPAR